MVNKFAELTVEELLSSLKQGDIDARSLVEASLDSLRELDKSLNISAFVFEEHAMSRLETLQKRAPFFGLPIAIKDTFSLPWHAPQDGTGVSHSAPGIGESDLFKRLDRLGATVLFSTNPHQLGFGTTGHVSAHGPCRNPWDPERCAGGSSGGSAVAVATGIVPFAIGTDAAGSIRVPAAYCGLVGLKPTWGSIGVQGSSSPSDLMAIGPIARSSRDCKVVTELILDRPMTFSDERLNRKVGVPVRLWENLHPDIADAGSHALQDLERAGFEIVSIHRDFDPDSLAEMNAVGLALQRRGRLTDDWRASVMPQLHPAIQAKLRDSDGLTEADELRVARYRHRLIRKLDELFSEVDFLAWPTAPAPPPTVIKPRAQLPTGLKSSDLAVMGLTSLANLSGIPSISLPCGFDSSSLPVGLSLHARWGMEHTLFAAAERYESTTESRRFTVPGIIT